MYSIRCPKKKKTSWKNIKLKKNSILKNSKTFLVTINRSSRLFKSQERLQAGEKSSRTLFLGISQVPSALQRRNAEMSGDREYAPGCSKIVPSFLRSFLPSLISALKHRIRDPGNWIRCDARVKRCRDQFHLACTYSLAHSRDKIVSEVARTQCS